MRDSDVGAYITERLSAVGPWFSRTGFGKWHGRINAALVIIVSLFILWKSIF